MIFVRGFNEDYDNWERLGNPGWGWAHMQHALADYVAHFPDLYVADNSRPLMQPMLQALQNAGYGYNPDPVFGPRQSGITNFRYTLKYQGLDEYSSKRQTTFTQYVDAHIAELKELEVRPVCVALSRNSLSVAGVP